MSSGYGAACVSRTCRRVWRDGRSSSCLQHTTHGAKWLNERGMGRSPASVHLQNCVRALNGVPWAPLEAASYHCRAGGTPEVPGSTLGLQTTCPYWDLIPRFLQTNFRIMLKRIRIPLFSTRGGLISLWLYKGNYKLRDWKNVFTLYIPPWAPHTYCFVVLTSLTHPRKIILFVLQIGKAKDLSAPLSIFIAIRCPLMTQIFNSIGP
jgi:hypothetical protein